MSATVIGALRRFLPSFRATAPPLSTAQRRALWAITHCRTPALGGQAFACQRCGRVHFAWHSCNHKACPQCGRQATARWIARELAKRVAAPYFLVTFTLSAELRGEFFGPHAKQAYDLFFTAVARALAEKLASAKGLRAHVSGFTAVLHTWNQRLGFHPHIHCLVPGAGLDARGRPVRVKQANYLVCETQLTGAFRQHLRRLFKAHDWSTDPAAWNTQWHVDIQPVGSGTAALKYLGTYVARTAISDGRLLAVGEQTVTFRWQDREHDRSEELTLPGIEFVRRYLRHVLPTGMRSVRYYGFCHPAAKAKRLRVQCHTGMPVQLGATATAAAPQAAGPPPCPYCGGPTEFRGTIAGLHRNRAPPRKSRRPSPHRPAAWPRIAA